MIDLAETFEALKLNLDRLTEERLAELAVACIDELEARAKK